MNVDRAVIEADVFPAQHSKLTGARVEIDRQRDESAPLKRHRVAFDELLKLARVEILLRRCGAPVRAEHPSRGVVVAHTEFLLLRRARILGHLGSRAPDVAGSLPRQLTGLYFRVERAHQRTKIVRRPRLHVLAAKGGRYVNTPVLIVLANGSHAASLTISDPEIEPGGPVTGIGLAFAGRVRGSAEAFLPESFGDRFSCRERACTCLRRLWRGIEVEDRAAPVGC
ncbi:MAG TPA: hypothetical protein VHM70_26420 [Polyangiaceae bacterium]|nr:hypothetical protein [Polyangiaceae bacterium]